MDLTTLDVVKAWIGGIPAGEVLSVTVTDEGTGYHAETTTLALSGVLGQGSDFTAVPVIVAEKIVAVVITNPGSLYLKATPPTLEATDTDGTPGSGASFTLQIAEIDSTADALLSRLITSGSQFFASRCSRAALIATSGIVEAHDGHFGQQRIILLESPVTAVASVSVNGVAQIASGGPPTPGFGFDADGIFLRGSCFADGFQNVVVTYTAGYAANSGEAAMIEQAVTELVGTKYRRRTHIDEVSRGIAGGASQTVTFSQADVSAEVQTAINTFSRPVTFGG